MDKNSNNNNIANERQHYAEYFLIHHYLAFEKYLQVLVHFLPSGGAKTKGAGLSVKLSLFPIGLGKIKDVGKFRQ